MKISRFLHFLQFSKGSIHTLEAIIVKFYCHLKITLLLLDLGHGSQTKFHMADTIAHLVVQLTLLGHAKILAQLHTTIWQFAKATILRGLISWRYLTTVMTGF